MKHFTDTFFLLAMYHKKVLLKPNYLISILLYFEICHKCLYSQGYGVLFVFVLVGWLVGWLGVVCVCVVLVGWLVLDCFVCLFNLFTSQAF